MSGAYVYGIVGAEAAAPLEVVGLEDAPVRQVAHGAVAALVSDVHGELLGRRSELLRHADVVGAALERGPVLPLQFGTVFTSDAAVVSDLLQPREVTLVDLLDKVRGQVEVRLRGYYDEERILAEVVAERPQLQRTGASLDDRIRVGEEVAGAIERRRAADANAIVQRLLPLATDVAGQEAASTMMVLNAAFLLDRQHLERFDRAVEDVGRELAPRIQLRYVGPFPPASFVDLELAS